MAHYAELDEDDNVTQVIVVANAELDEGGVESEAKGIAFLSSLYGHSRWVQCSYNARIRKNYPSAGYTYDRSRDAFVPPQLYPSWLLDEETCQWVPPVTPPGSLREWRWDENTLNWIRY